MGRGEKDGENTFIELSPFRDRLLARPVSGGEEVIRRVGKSSRTDY
jgi:hypothetical protein